MINFLKLILAIVGFAFLAEVSFGQGDAPPILKGLNQADKSIGAFIRTPNGQATKISSSSALIETGNNNILENPSFEHSVYDTSWVINSGTSSKIDVNTDSTKVVHGLNALKMTMAASPLDILNVSPTSNQSFKDGVQGLISVRVKTSVSGVKVCQRVGFSTNFNNCVNVTANGKWGLYKVPSILGEFYNGIVVTSQGVSITGDVYIDDAFVGPVDLKADIDSSKIVGSSYFTGSANPTVSTEAVFSNSGVNAPTINFSNIGLWDTTDSNAIQQTVNNLPAGCYRAEFTHLVSHSTTASVLYNTCITENGTESACTNASRSYSTQPSNGSSNTKTTRDICFSQSGNRTFALRGAASSGSIFVNFSGTVGFSLYYFSSGSTYSSTNADTDWASCGHTASSFTGFGTVSAIETQCKRQGADLLMRGKFTGGTSTAVEARLSLPVWNGVQLVSAGTSVIPSIQISGIGRQTAASAGYFVDVTLMEPSVSYLTFGQATSTTSGVTKLNGSAILASGNTLFINARIPIEGWQNSNIIIGQFNGLESCSSTLNCTDTFSAKVSATGVVTDENVDWISGNASVATATYTMTYNTGIFTVAPNCVVSSSTASNATLSTIAHLENNPTSTQVVVETGSPADAAYDFNIVCQKQGVDYIGKTAKAVASDQNIRTPGVTKAVFYSALISSAGAMTNEIGDIFNGSCTCTTGNYSCTFTSNIWSSSPNCQVTNPGAIRDRTAWSVSASTSTLTFAVSNSAGTGICEPVNISCHGVSP